MDTAALIRRMADPLEIARLDRPGAALIASTDPTGGNDDFGHFLRDGPPGWKVMADVSGPGFVSRFWFTGARDGGHRVRLFFDDEATPRVDMSLAEFCGGSPPHQPPFAAYENYAWYNLIPLPFARRFVAMCEAPAKPRDKLYFQINVNALPPESVVVSFPGSFSEEERAALADVARRWQYGPVFDALSEQTFQWIRPGEERAWGETAAGPGLISAIAFELDAESLPDAQARTLALRDVRLLMYWDGASEPSVAAPLGDFFGNGWQRVSHASALWRTREWTFEARWPMPFRKSARVALYNAAPTPLRFRAAWRVEPNPTPERLGYFHAEFRRSGPGAGAPHTALEARGRGHYAGIVLSAVGATKTGYALLEGDELIRRDGERLPGWQGTGLEDYFNGGWYYQNVLARPLHGLTFKAPYRTVQHRIHALDRVAFEREIELAFERGPRNAEPGWMESVAFYYLDRPAAAFRGHLAGAMHPPPAPLEANTIMIELWNLERWGDLKAANERLELFLQRHPRHSEAEMLRLRQAAYRAELEGFESVRDVFEAAARSSNPDVREAADHLLWFHADPGRALLFLYASMPARAFVNGRETIASAGPRRVAVARIENAAPAPRISIEAKHSEYPDWAQLLYRAHAGDIHTHPGWRAAVDPPGEPHRPDYDDSDWLPLGGTGVKGPPDDAFAQVAADPYIHVQSRAIGLRNTRPWPPGAKTIVYRSPQ